MAHIIFVARSSICNHLKASHLLFSTNNQRELLSKQHWKRKKPNSSQHLSWKERLADVVTPLWRLSYEEQLEVKYNKQESILSQLCGDLKCIRGKPNFPVLPVLPSPVQNGYRNKSTFSVNKGVDGNPKTVGFYVGKARGNNIVCVNADHLLNMPEKHTLVARCYQDFIRLSPLEPCLLFHTGGHWREITIRTNAQGHTMAIVYFHPQALLPEEKAVHKAALVDYFTRGPGSVCELDSLFLQESTMTRCSHEESPYQLLHGVPYIYEEVLGFKFRISPEAFFQVNQAAAEVLYRTVRDLCTPSYHNETENIPCGGTLLDVCCGTGAIGIITSPRVDKVIGIELVEQAVEDATHNADSTILVYVSCKPEGEAMRNFRELCCAPDHQKKLTGEAFTPTLAVPVDMFPHTPHSKSTTAMTETRTISHHAPPQKQQHHHQNGHNTTPADDVFDATYKEKEGRKPQMQLVWRNIILMFLLHVGAVYGFTLIPSAKTLTLVWTAVCYAISGLGITAGAHRLWSHRTYKASFPLRVFLAFANSMAFQNDIYEWARDHRSHHKYSETDADPHNAKRGFFFSHVGWLLVRKHPEVVEQGKKLDLSDLKADPVVMFQRRHYVLSLVLLCFALPTLVPWYCWGESLETAYFLPGLFRYALSLNATWLVNSAAHMWGNRPYDITINPRENRVVSFSAMGEGFHNYHHTFPFDYGTSEFGWRLNPTTAFIDLMCFLGLAWDRKKVSKEMILARMQRTGSGSNKSG
ncbi:hypothetical protein WMY93_018143 [Mugilogobius chulae]|uniref:tRNA (uracil(54)-C(5))-methyltransferase n=1 Tax=Mugilogobius chulae TaxID=88201 RepID=A0AAW0NVA4_9GOBI